MKKRKSRPPVIIIFFVILARSGSAILFPTGWGGVSLEKIDKNKRGTPLWEQNKSLTANPNKHEHTVSRRQTTCVRVGKTRPFLLCARVLSKAHILYSFRRATSARGACVFILVFSNCDATLLSRAHTPNVKAKKLLRVYF